MNWMDKCANGLNVLRTKKWKIVAQTTRNGKFDQQQVHQRSQDVLINAGWSFTPLGMDQRSGPQKQIINMQTMGEWDVYMYSGV